MQVLLTSVGTYWPTIVRLALLRAHSTLCRLLRMDRSFELALRRSGVMYNNFTLDSAAATVRYTA